MIWVAHEPRRFLDEREAIRALQRSGSWLRAHSWRVSEKNELTVNASLDVRGELHEVELVYPELFPDTPAFVRPKDRSARWSAHQFTAGGTLCLQYRPDNWNRSITGADLLRSAFELLEGEHPTSVAEGRRLPSAHKQTVGQELRSAGMRVLVSEEVDRKLQGLKAGSAAGIRAKGRFFADPPQLVIFFTNFEDGGELQAIADIPKVLASDEMIGVRYEGWAFLGDKLSEHRTYKSAAELVAHVRESGFETFEFPADSSETYIVVLCSPSGSRRFVLVAPNGDWQIRPLAALPTMAGGSRRLPARLTGLGSKKVAVIGLGSVGSKVAAMLGRSGVRNLLLVDDDVLLGENIVRHELDWGAVGLHKTEAMKDRLALVATDVQVEVVDFRVGGQESSLRAAAVLKSIGTCDLIVDATANADAFLPLAAVARRQKRPMVWGELLAGGAGALVMRSRPGNDCPPLEMRTSVHRYLEDLPPAPDQAAQNYDDVEGEALIATDADVSFLAAILGQIALDTLAQGPSEFPYSAYLIGMKNYWVFEQPFDVRPIVTPTVEASSGNEASDPQAITETLEALAEILPASNENAGTGSAK